MTTPDRLAFDQEVSLFLATCRTATLATVDTDGGPCAANVQYVHDTDFRLFWVSSPESMHSVNLQHEPRVAITVYAHDDRAENIHGLQMRGVAGVVEAGEPTQSAFDLYTDKFAFIAANPQLRAAVEKQRFYEFTPTWLRWIDNRVRFGHKVEISLDASPHRAS
ncbi:MAG: pyridoxamine 5'-phosphate oxidase family protein [Planctomycetota bacterium]